MLEDRGNQSFREGERRENHEECGDNRERKYTRRVGTGWVWYCHNCGERGFVNGESTSPSETVQNVIRTISSNGAEQRTDEVRRIRLPSDVSQSKDSRGLSIIPPTGLAWLYKYEILDEEIKQYNICYSESYKRLILPVYDASGLIYWQGRNLGKVTKENPKYLNIRQSGAKNVYFKIHRHNSVQSDTLVIVEDILSAIKVGRYYNSLALLGSYFPLDILKEFSDYKKVFIYLDSDKWKESIKAAKRFNQLTGKQFIVKYHEKDPKALSDKELITFLEGD